MDLADGREDCEHNSFGCVEISRLHVEAEMGDESAGNFNQVGHHLGVGILGVGGGARCMMCFTKFRRMMSPCDGISGV